MSSRGAPRLFISYAAKDASWLSNFLHEDRFKPHLGTAVLQDYQDTANFGSIRDWIDEQVGQSAALLAFISRSYIASKYSREEWELALDLYEQRGLVVVPVIMDDDAIAWWTEQKAEFGSRFTTAVGD